METDQRELHLLVKRFLEGTASSAEREKVHRLLETDVIDDLMQKELYRLQRRNLVNPFGLYKATGKFEAIRHRLFQNIILDDRLELESSIDEDFDRLEKVIGEDIIEEIVHFRPEASIRWGRVCLYALAVMTAIVVATAFWFSFSPGQSHAEAILSTTSRRHVLPDGSVVGLNQYSSVSYRQNMVREVTLVGEAHFDVAPDSGHPFVIHAGDIQIKTLGTGISVRAGPEQDVIVITVTHGQAEVGRGINVFDVVRPNEELTIDLRTSAHTKKSTEPNAILQWFRRLGL